MAKNFETLLVERDRGVTTITLNRPEIHNAFNEDMIAELVKAFSKLGKDAATRVIVLTGAGESFCAGADLHWMKRVASYTPAQNRADAKRLHQMLLAVYRCPKPVVAHVNGAAIGGGTGLLAAVDMAFADSAAVFGFSEVRLGLIPAVISPFVIRKIGEANAREFFLTGERFPAQKAQEMGLVQYQGNPEYLHDKMEEKVRVLQEGGPSAQAACKRLIEKIGGQDLAKVGVYTSAQIARLRGSKEGREGIRAFLTKRKPNWVQ